ncbi:hypothetical protein BDF22DRAFT_690535 [Syncephalis plumigaleata]|nr:hypothetical protein BDF22DRAFT_690535 [Syncephalis plumigaleata]
MTMLFTTTLRGMNANAHRMSSHCLRVANATIQPRIPCRDIRTAVNQIRRGHVVDFRSKIWIVCKRDHGKTGRGGAVIKIELKDAMSGIRQTERFNSGDALEVLQLRIVEHQYLYSKGNRAYFLNNETYEELEMDVNAIDGTEKHLDLLEDGMMVSVQMLETEQPIMYRLPKTHIYTVTRDEPTASQASKGVSYKTAYVADGKIRLSVPEFVKPGDRVVVDLENIAYVSRDAKA